MGGWADQLSFVLRKPAKEKHGSVPCFSLPPATVVSTNELINITTVAGKKLL